MSEWDLEPGDVTTRSELHKRYGGATQGGIEPSNSTPNIFVFSDLKSGASHGYKYDRWEGDVFHYTGQGKVGDQLYQGRNLSLMRHKETDRKVRVFQANGMVKGTQTVSQVYLGEFKVDPELTHVERDAPDDNGDNRTVIVFRLVPLGKHSRPAQVENPKGPGQVRPEVSAPTVVPIEVTRVTEFSIGPSESRVGTKRESDLVNRYVEVLRANGSEVTGYHIPVADQPYPLRVDIYDHTNQDIIEAKSSSSREHVRSAIGQLLDYRRYVSHKRISVLLPKKPREDLLDLLSTEGIDCVFESSAGRFQRLSSNP